jgi:hypothetical protein
VAKKHPDEKEDKALFRKMFATVGKRMKKGSKKSAKRARK